MLAEFYALVIMAAMAGVAASSFWWIGLNENRTSWTFASIFVLCAIAGTIICLT